MNKALAHAGVTHLEMAEHLGVNPSTMRTWTSGRIRPRAGMLRQWALRCGVPYEWLLNGWVTGDTPPSVDTKLTVTQEAKPRVQRCTRSDAPNQGRFPDIRGIAA